MDLALNNLQRLICHKTQPTKINAQITKKKKLNKFYQCTMLMNNNIRTTL